MTEKPVFWVEKQEKNRKKNAVGERMQMQVIKYCLRCNEPISDIYHNSYHSHIALKYCEACRKVVKKRTGCTGERALSKTQNESEIIGKMVRRRNVQHHQNYSWRTWKRHEETTKTDRREMRGSGKRVAARTGKKRPSHRRQPVTRDSKKIRTSQS